MKTFFQRLRALLPATAFQRQSTVDSRSDRANVTLEQQLKTLAPFGLTLNDGIVIDDLLHSWDRSEFESQPYGTLLFVLGSEVDCEPWGRNICDRAWNFDSECIEDTGSYVAIVKNLCRVAGMPDLVSNLDDYVDIENGTAWLKYTIDGQQRHFKIRVDNDWADPKTVSAIIHDIERDGKRFYGKDNGQATIWFYLNDETANKLNVLTGNALKTNN